MSFRYDTIIKDVCHVTWEKLNSDLKTCEDPELALDLKKEIDGWVGVGLIAAYLRGVKANVEDMALHFDLPFAKIDRPLRRLISNGVFSQKFDIKNDDVIKGRGCPPEATRTAWCFLAGIASGFCGLQEECL